MKKLILCLLLWSLICGMNNKYLLFTGVCPSGTSLIHRSEDNLEECEHKDVKKNILLRTPSYIEMEFQNILRCIKSNLDVSCGLQEFMARVILGDYSINSEYFGEALRLAAENKNIEVMQYLLDLQKSFPGLVKFSEPSVELAYTFAYANALETRKKEWWRLSDRLSGFIKPCTDVNK